MKQVSVFVTNKTPIQVTVSGHVILARATKHELSVYNSSAFIGAVKQAYPRGEVVAWTAQDEQTKEIETANHQSENLDGGQDDSTHLAFDDLGLSNETTQLLNENGVKTVDELCAMTAQQVLDIKGIGEKTLADIELALEASNLTLKEVE